MVPTLFVALVLPMQSPPPLPPPAAAPPKPPAPTATAAQLADRYQLELTRTNQRKKLAALKKNAQRSAKAHAEYQEAIAQQAYLDRMAPIWAAEARENARVAAAQQSANAMSSMANAAQKRAAIAAAQLKIEARQAGYPQIGLQQVVP